MSDLVYRTEDIQSDELLNYFAETDIERNIINAFKSRNPIILVGSRGVGKSFLLRVAEKEMLTELSNERIFPVYITFNKSSLIHTNDSTQFKHWMLAKICTHLVRSLRKAGKIATIPTYVALLSGGNISAESVEKAGIEEIEEAFEHSWQNPGSFVDTSIIPSVDIFKSVIEDLCEDLGLARITLLIDEAAHIFLPEQQRQFFTLFRDLRSPYINCNAAVYPGVTSYGEIFEPAHDATFLTLERDVLSDNFAQTMRDIVQKQADSSMMANIVKNGQNFNLLAYASNGNPRVLLKTLIKAPKVSSQQVNNVIREYYRTDIWAEHSALGDKYPGHRVLVDWGRYFIEDDVLPKLQRRNSSLLRTENIATCFFWIHRDIPHPVRESLRLLAYTGIVTEHSSGIRLQGSQVGIRYIMHLGCLIALEQTPTATGFNIVKSLALRRMSEYSANHRLYEELLSQVPEFNELVGENLLQRQLTKSVDVLDLTKGQHDALKTLGLMTIGDLLRASENKLKEARYVGDIRARRMRNAAIAAVYEFLSG